MQARGILIFGNCGSAKPDGSDKHIAAVHVRVALSMPLVALWLLNHAGPGLVRDIGLVNC
jgi:hypothetical protein